MKMLNERRFAMVTTELAVSLVLVTVVLFVTVGLFGDSLKETVANGNFNNMFKGNYNSTFFTFFKRDYSNAQIDVQVMSEEGLERIRQNANNTSIELIDKVFDEPKPSLKEADTIAYLAQVINVIVGSPDICDYMQKPSKEPCPKIVNIGTRYQVTLQSGLIMVKRVGGKGKEMQLNVEKALPASVVEQTPSADDLGSDQVTNKFKAIEKIVKKYDGKIDKKYSLMREIQSWKPSSALPTKGSGSRRLEDQLKAMLQEIQTQASGTGVDCNDWKLFTGNMCDWLGVLCPDRDVQCSDNTVITGDALKVVDEWTEAVGKKLTEIANGLPEPVKRSIVPKEVIDSPSCSGLRVCPQVQQQVNLYIPSTSLLAKSYDSSIYKGYSSIGGNTSLVAGSEDALLIAVAKQIDISCDPYGEGSCDPERMPVEVNDNEIPDVPAYQIDERLSTIRNRAELTQVITGYKNMASSVKTSYGIRVNGQSRSVDNTKIIAILDRDKTGRSCRAFVDGYNKIMEKYGMDYQKIPDTCRVTMVKPSEQHHDSTKD